MFKMRFLFAIVLVLLIAGFVQEYSVNNVHNKSFTTGEKLEYRAHWGFLNGGEATITIDSNIYYINKRPCYRINVLGKTTSTVDIAYRVRDEWGTYLDTALLIPHQSYRKIRENKYRRDEVVHFDHFAKNAEVKIWDRKKNKYKEPKNYHVPYGVQDLVSGYYFLRNVDYNKLKVGSIIKVDAFFEDSLYNFKVKYLGREVLKTKLGNLKSLKLSPIMPENDLFSGENAIQVWLSDDPNKIPLKISADMKVVGEVELDIKRYSGLRH